MKHEQMGKYVALINKFQHNKKSKKLASSLHHRLNIGHFPQTIDAAVFRQTIQQKIKNKYKEPKRTKTLQMQISKTSELDQQSQEIRISKKKLDALKEEQSSRELKRAKLNFFRNGNELSLNSKSKRLFLNTSNLLMTPQSNYIQDRKTIRPEHQLFQRHSKTSNVIFKTFDTESLMLNNYPNKTSLIEKIPKLKFQSKQHSYILSNVKAQTLPDDMQQSKIQYFQQKQKETLNQILKSRNPLSIKKKILKQIVTIPQNLTRSDLISVPHRLSKQKYNKITSHRIQKISKDFSNGSGKYQIQRGLLTKHKDKFDAISGWQYDQQF